MSSGRDDAPIRLSGVGYEAFEGDGTASRLRFRCSFFARRLLQAAHGPTAVGPCSADPAAGSAPGFRENSIHRGVVEGQIGPGEECHPSEADQSGYPCLHGAAERIMETGKLLGDRSYWVFADHGQGGIAKGRRSRVFANIRE